MAKREGDLPFYDAKIKKNNCYRCTYSPTSDIVLDSFIYEEEVLWLIYMTKLMILKKQCAKVMNLMD